MLIQKFYNAVNFIYVNVYCFYIYHELALPTKYMKVVLHHIDQSQ
jgi:hypothetical protein